MNKELTLENAVVPVNSKESVTFSLNVHSLLWSTVTFTQKLWKLIKSYKRTGTYISVHIK